MVNIKKIQVRFNENNVKFYGSQKLTGYVDKK